MKWSIKQIEELGGLPLQFSEIVDVKSSLMKRESEIIDVSTVKLAGQLLYDNHSFLAMFTIEVIVTLPSSRTLSPVPITISFDVYERYVDIGYLSQYVDYVKDEVIVPLDSQYIDLTESVIDSILLNLPIQVLSDDEQTNTDLPSGNGWVLLTEDDYRKKKQKEAEDTIDPRFAGLQTLLTNEDQNL